MKTEPPFMASIYSKLLHPSIMHMHEMSLSFSFLGDEEINVIIEYNPYMVKTGI